MILLNNWIIYNYIISLMNEKFQTNNLKISTKEKFFFYI